MPDNWWTVPYNRNIIIKHGRIVNADSDERLDVKIEKGKIKEVKRTIVPSEDYLLIDATDMYVMPGGIDTNTHFDYEYNKSVTVDDFYYGTRAAVSGGTTTIMDFVIPEIGEPLEEAYRRWRRRADTEVVCDYCLHMALTWWDEEIEKEMNTITIGCGINGFMMYMAFKESYMLDDTQIYQACLRCKDLGAIAMVHAENGSIIEENVKGLLKKGVKDIEGFYLSRPEDVEEEATLRACAIANQVKCPLYVCNIMSKPAADIIARKRKLGQLVFGETTPAALGGTGPQRENLSYRIAAAYVTSPPISDNKSTPIDLMNMLRNGELSTTGSQNCTYNNEQKARGRRKFTKIPIGVNGVEDRMSVIWEKGVNSGILSPSQFVAITSTNAAKIFNLYPKKGIIAPGADADIVVWNPQKSRVISHYNHRQACDYNIFDGMRIRGVPEYVFVRGSLCLENQVLRTDKGYGNYIHRACYSEGAYHPYDDEIEAKITSK